MLEGLMQKEISKKLLSMQKAAVLVKHTMQEMSAVDTGHMEASIIVKAVREDKNGLYALIGTEGVDYAKKVDQGVDGAVFDYHRNGRVIYTGVGLQLVKRAKQRVMSEVISLLK